MSNVLRFALSAPEAVCKLLPILKKTPKPFFNAGVGRYVGTSADTKGESTTTIILHRFISYKK